MDPKRFSFVGPSCGTHASYTFYKAIKYKDKAGKARILSLGEFFFVKIWSNSDIVAVGELQLIWEDKAAGQSLSSLRLYFLPEYTPEGRLHTHGEDEVVAVSEKSVLRVVDLLDWIAVPCEVVWDRGLSGVHHPDGSALSLGEHSLYPEFLEDVRQEKVSIGDTQSPEDLAVIILSLSQYARYRSVLKRISGAEKDWISHSLVLALGGFTAPTKNTFVLFCREHFDYPELEEHPYLCNHLAPKLKGRPRKKKYHLKRPGSPESESASSESSLSLSSSKAESQRNSPASSKNTLKKDLILILSQKKSREELDFLRRLTRFMDKRSTPIERPPMLGFKQIDLHLFFEKVSKLGGYEACMSKKLWKAVYDDIGGNPQNTSAATCTRRHYEKFLLPYEQYLKGQEEEEQKMSLSSKPDPVPEEEEESSEENTREASSPSALTEPKTLAEPIEDDQPNNVLPQEQEEDEQREETSKAEEPEDPFTMSSNGGEEQQSLEEEQSCAEEDGSVPKEKMMEEDDNAEQAEEQLQEQPSSPSQKDSEIIPDVTITKQPQPKAPSSPHIASQQQRSSESPKAASSPQLQLDPEGKRLQIDDLIIIPNNLSVGAPEGGGSALQNLAKIASRYQNQGGGEGKMPQEQSTEEPCLKRPKISSEESPFASNGKQGKTAAPALPVGLNNPLFSMIPPGMLPGASSSSWIPPKTSSSPSKNNNNSSSSSSSVVSGATSNSNTAAGLFSSFPGLADAMKLGADGYHLLQFYENQMKTALAARGPPTPPETLFALYEKELKTAQQSLKLSNGSSSSSIKSNESLKASSSVPPAPPPVVTPSSSPSPSPVPKDVRNKVCKPPPETKRPPSLLQTPCAFLQTSHIYSNPLSELTQVREAAAKSTGPQLGGLDLSKGNLLKAEQRSLMDLSKRGGGEPKANPFSAEALLSKPAKHPDLAKVSPSLSVRSGLTMSPEHHHHHHLPPASSPHSPSPYRKQASNTSASSTSPSLSSKSRYPPEAANKRSSPWHTPVGTSRGSPAASGKPAIPVSPVVRESKSKQLSNNDFASSLMGLANSFSSSSSGNSGGGGGGGIPGLSSPQVNPYLALMASAAGAPPPKSPVNHHPPPPHSSASNPFPHHLMDPATSAYYAALYSQQMFGLSPFAAAPNAASSSSSSLRPSFHHPPSSSASSAPPSQQQQPSASSGLDHLQASALQAMMARSAAAAHPYSYAGLATGGAGAFLGLHPNHPHHPSRKDT